MMRRRALPKTVKTVSAALLSASLALPPALPAQNLRLPDFGDPSLQYFGAEEERRLGAQVLSRLRARGAIVDDVQLEEYLNSIGQRLAAYADQPGHPYQYYWINAGSINAFAAPGGFIGIHSGLMMATRGEDELAGVVAHETAHVSQRHIARGIADARQLSLPLAAAMLAGIALAAAGNNQVGQAAQVGAAALSAQRRINFTRANEQEADRIGGQLLASAGFDVQGLSRFFARLQRAQSGVASKVPEFLLTHPLPRERIADADARNPDADRRAEQRSPLDYHLAKARLRVLTSSDTQALQRYFSERLRSGGYQNEAAERYGYALSLHRAGRYAEATQQIERLRAADPDQLGFRILDAEIALARGDRERAWALFEDSLALYPDDFRLSLHYAEALTTGGRPQQALTLLQPQLKRRPDHVKLFETYARAGRSSGQRTLTHGAMAELAFLNGELEQAVEQAELGLRAGDGSSYQRAQLQTRLRQFERQLTQQKRAQ